MDIKKLLKKILDKLLLLAIAFGILIAVAGIALYYADAGIREIERKNKADPIYQEAMAKAAEKEKAKKEEQKRLDKLSQKQLEEEKAIADFEKSINGKYNKEYLSNKLVSDKKMANHLFTMGEYECMNYWYTSHDWDDDLYYDELSYYVFKNQKAAKKAFNNIKESWIESETDAGKNYVQGWEAGVCDASVEIFIYQTDNMIITAKLQVVSAWSEPEYEDSDNSAVNFNYRKKFILDHF